MRGTGRWRNWGRNQLAVPAAIDEPRSLLEVVESVANAKNAGQTVKVVASGHSFSDVAVTSGRMMRIGALDRLVAIDRDAMTATVEAGIPLWRLNDELAKRGLALSNLGDIDRQTIAGATSTGTHGTGLKYGSIAAAIVGLEIVTADGDVVRCSATEEPEIFACARVGLGVLGVVTQVTLQCEPLFKLRAVEIPIPWDDFLVQWDSYLDANDHVDCYWFPHSDTCTIKTSNRTEDPIRTRRGYKKWKSEIYYGNFRHGANAAYGRLRPDKIPELARDTVATFHRTERVDLSYNVFCTTRLVRFVEMEYAIPARTWPAGCAPSVTSSSARACSWTSRSRSGESVLMTSPSAWDPDARPATSRSTSRRARRSSATSAASRRSWTASVVVRTGGRCTSRPRAPWRRDTRSGSDFARCVAASILRVDLAGSSPIGCLARRRLPACPRIPGSSSMRARTSSST